MKKKIKTIILFLSFSLALGWTTVAYGQININNNENKIIKLEGKNRYDTTIKVCNDGWEKSDYVVIVNGQSICDALCSVPLAKMVDGPVLLTSSNNLNNDVECELKRLNCKNAYLIGGEGVISKNVETSLNKMSIKTTRIAGVNRVETSKKVAEKISENNGFKFVAIVNGYIGLPDGLSISAPAGEDGIPILLTDMNDTENVTKWVEKFNPNNSFLIGGEGVISNEVYKKAINGYRIGGVDRKETNENIIKTFYKEKEYNNLFICKDGTTDNNRGLVDSLVASAYAAKIKAPVLLSGNVFTDKQKSMIIEEFIYKNHIKKIFAVGGGISEHCLKYLEDNLNYKIKPSGGMPAPVEPTKPENIKENIN